jgi:predicted TIM-barrel fold metal-dependent hydrolase
MQTVHEIVRQTGGKYEPVLKAARELGLPGQVQRSTGARMWTEAEAAQIVARVRGLGLRS